MRVYLITAVVMLAIVCLLAFTTNIFAVDPAGEYDCSTGVCTLKVPVEVEVELTDPIPGVYDLPTLPDPRISEPVVPVLGAPIVGPYPDAAYGDIVILPVVAPTRTACGARSAGGCGARSACGARARGFRLFSRCR